MKSSFFPPKIGAVVAVAVAVCLAPLPAARAFPPAPHHLLYGTVRDQYGTPLLTSVAQIVLTTPAGAQVSTVVVPGIGFDMNYELDVPMDAGLTPDPYEPNALLPGTAYTLSVVIGTTTNMPLQMIGGYLHIGQPGQQTRVDLTLGVDANGDGIPDAWEYAFLAAIGSNLSLSNLNAGSRLTPDGMTLQQQFIAGNYPFDPVPFVLTLVDPNHGSPVLQFTSMTGRYYTLLGSADLQNWTPMNFLLPSEGPAGTAHPYLFTPGIQTTQIQAQQPATGPPMRFFRLMLQ